MKISLRISIVYSALRSPMQTIIRSVPALCRVGRLHYARKFAFVGVALASGRRGADGRPAQPPSPCNTHQCRPMESNLGPGQPSSQRQALTGSPPVLSCPCLGLSHTTGRTSGRSIVIVSSRSGSASAFTVHPSIPATTSSAGHRERALSCPLQPVRSHRERARPRRCRVEDENRAFPLHLSRPPPCRGY